MSVTQISLLVFFLVKSTTAPVFAQIKSAKFEIGAGLAGFVYQGDLTPNPVGSFATTRPGVVISAAKIFSESFLVRASLSVGGLRGDETKYDKPEYRKFRAFKFRTPLMEISPQIVWNPLRKINAGKGFSPYLFAGAGLTFMNIKRDYSGFDAAYFGDGSDIPDRLVQDEQHPLPKFRLVMPVGAGIRYHLSDRIAVNAESSYRFPFTDYLDGFSRAANPEQKDHYHSLMIGAIYRIGNKTNLACPVIKY